MNHPIPSGDYVEHFDPELPHHRAWLLAVLEQLVAHEPQALGEGGTLRRLWTAHQAAAGAGPAPRVGAPRPHHSQGGLMAPNGTAAAVNH